MMNYLALLIVVNLINIFAIHNAYAQTASPALSNTSKHRLTLPSTSMREALSMVSQHYKVQLLYSSALVSGLASHSVKNAENVAQALEQLFLHSHLSYQLIDNQTLLIFKARNRQKKKSLVPDIKLPTNQLTAASAAPIEYVLVTGSRLPRNQYDAPYPTHAIHGNVINNDVHITLSAAVNSYPAFCEPNFSLNSFNPNNIGESFSDLYCLGSQRTLSLINGRRTVSTNEPALPNSEPGLQVDLNMLPRLMIKNIEVIGVGGAPVYGSDAIAGTVNILLHDNFEGIKFDFQTAFADQTGGEQINIGGLFGSHFLDERARVIGSYEFHKQKALSANDRLFTRSNFGYIGITPNPSQNRPQGFLFTDNITNPTLTVSGIPTPNGDGFPLFAIGENRFTDNQNTPLSFDAQGRLSPFQLGALSLDLERTVGGDGIQEQTNQFIQLPSERHAFALNAYFDITPSITAFSELQFYSARFESRGTGFEVVASLDTQQHSNSTLSINENFNSLPLATDYPFLSQGDAELLNNALSGTQNNTPTSIFYLHKDWSGIVDPNVDVRSQIVRIVLGLEGEFTRFNRDVSWHIVANHGQSASTTTSQRLNRSRFNQSLDSVLDLNSNTPVCRDDSNGCAPLNVLGLHPSQAAINFVTQSFIEQGDLEQNMITASVQTALFTLNGGDVRFLMGTEARKEKAIYTPPSDYQEPRLPVSNTDLSLISDFNDQRINNFSTAEFFVEALAPILGNDIVPGVEKLELEANWRGVDHSIAGDDDAWTTALRLTLNPSWIHGRAILRSNITESIRSPTLLELASPLTPTQININDPCDKDFVNLGNIALAQSRRTNCSNEATLSGFAYNNQTFESQVPRLAPLSLEGTLTLKNEQARATSTGIIYQHDGNNQFNISIDYVDIEVNKAIVLRDIQRTLNNCYDTNNENDCNDIIRISDFQIFGIRNVYQNIGQISLKAWQYAMDVEVGADVFSPTLSGDLTFSLNAYELKEYLVDNPNAVVDRAGQLQFPRWQINTSLGYRYNNLSMQWRTLFTDSVNTFDTNADINSNAVTEAIIDSYLLHSLYLQYDATSAMSLALGINNILNTPPPFGLPSRNGGSTYNVVGRYFNLGLTLSF